MRKQKVHASGAVAEELPDHSLPLRANVINALHFGPDTSGLSFEAWPELIRLRAYQLFESRGRQPGRELDDWLAAERELRHHYRVDGAP